MPSASVNSLSSCCCCRPYPCHCCCCCCCCHPCCWRQILSADCVQKSYESDQSQRNEQLTELFKAEDFETRLKNKAEKLMVELKSNIYSLIESQSARRPGRNLGFIFDSDTNLHYQINSACPNFVISISETSVLFLLSILVLQPLFLRIHSSSANLITAIHYYLFWHFTI